MGERFATTRSVSPKTAAFKFLSFACSSTYWCRHLPDSPMNATEQAEQNRRNGFESKRIRTTQSRRNEADGLWSVVRACGVCMLL